MKLHEVLESGKQFGRKGKDFVYNPPAKQEHFSVDQILADDWEIVEQKIELTKSQIRDTIEYFGNAGMLVEHNIDLFLRELGFTNE